MSENDNIERFDGGASAEPPRPENPFAARAPQASPEAVEPIAQPPAGSAAVGAQQAPAVASGPQSAQPAPSSALRGSFESAPQQEQWAQQTQQAQQTFRPYAQAPAVSQQPAGAYAYDRAYGSYGAAPQPPVPPAPVYGYEAPAPAGGQGQKRRWPWFLLGLAVGLVIGLGGCVSCVGVMAAASYDDARSSYPDSRYYYDDSSRGDGLGGSDAAPVLPDVPDSVAPGTYTAEEIAETMFPDGAPSDVPADGSVCKAGMYTVGANGQIPAGLYYLQGTEDAESHYYVFEPAEGVEGRYEVDDSVVYFGNYFMQLDEGDLVVFKPAGDQTMYPAPSESIEPTVPYNDGCYRVGIDIPAGSYTITTYAPSAAATENECGAFVMKDLDFDSDSVVESAYVIPGGKQVVTVTEGQYLELFATTATPVTQG